MHQFKGFLFSQNFQNLKDFGILFILFLLLNSCRQKSDQYQSWNIYKGDAESSSYSALSQINKNNVDQLQIAWIFTPGDVPEGSRYGKYECNPIVIDSVMYASSARHWIYAINATNGQKIWSYDPFDGGVGGGVNRGVTYWKKSDDKRILFTAGNYLFALDAQRVYAPLGSPTYDYYGANREGENLFGNSLVALDANTGSLIWYFQIVHHDIWDYDLPAPPNLIQISRNGKMVDGVAQVTKHGFVFVFDRLTGAPLFPIEEREMPPSLIPGEYAWRTQPIPTKPEPYARQFITEADLSDFSPESHESVKRIYRDLRYEGLFTPPDLKGTLMVPGSRGGAEWGGAAFDPETGILYVNSNESPEIMKVQKVKQDDPSESHSAITAGRAIYMRYCAACHGLDLQGQEPINPPLRNMGNRLSKKEARDKIINGVGNMPPFGTILDDQIEHVIAFLYETEIDDNAITESFNADTTSEYFNVTAYSFFKDPEQRHAIKPPWGTLNAINLNSGEYVWKIPLGNNQELQKEGDPPTGTENWGGPMVTAGGIVFIAATADSKFRAFDKENGNLLWETTLPGQGYATPCSFKINGKQFVAIAVTGNMEEPGGYIIAFALSSPEDPMGVPS